MIDQNYEKQIYLAMMAEQCGRFEDMLGYIHLVIRAKRTEYSDDERSLLCVTFKHIISLKRTAIRTLSAFAAKEKKKSKSDILSHIQYYKNKIEEELMDFSQDVIDLIDDNLLLNTQTEDGKIFFTKMKADFYRYTAENIEGQMKSMYASESLSNYKEAEKLASKLDILNPTKLSLMLNMTVFYYEVMNDYMQACEIAKNVLDEAADKLEHYESTEENINQITHILDLIKENLNMWNLESEDDWRLSFVFMII